MKLLELFSGTGSIGKVARNLHWYVVSLDLKDADINIDILDWDYKQYPRGYYDFIWASPPCTEYSIAKQTGVRKLDKANKIVLKTLEIIDYFKPLVWFIENPQTGLLKKQIFMSGMPYKDIDYCIGRGPDFGTTWRIGNQDLYAIKIVEWWMATGIKKQHREHQVGVKKTGKKTIPFSNKGSCIEYQRHWLRKLWLQ